MSYRYLFPVLALVAVLCGPHPASAELSRRVDEQGVVHFGDSRPSGSGTVAVDRIAPFPIGSQSVPGPGSARTRYETEFWNDPGKTEERDSPTATVELFLTRSCGYCKRAKSFFAERDVAVTDCDVDRDHEAARRKRNLHPGRGVPPAVVNGAVIYRYKPAAYERAFNHRDG